MTVHSSRSAQIHHDDAVRGQERKRIGRELHDSTSQLLVVLQLNLACLKASSENPETKKLFRTLEQTLQVLHSEVRAVASSGKTPSLQEGLPASLRAMAKRFALLANIEVISNLRGVYGFPPNDVEMSLYRIAQEALANVARHAHARKIKLELDCRRKGYLKLTIEDDGVGLGSRIEPHVLEGTGIGNIRQRVRDMGGQLTLKQLRGGSLVAVTIHSPFRPAAAA